jgi:hypothetical protein
VRPETNQLQPDLQPQQQLPVDTNQPEQEPHVEMDQPQQELQVSADPPQQESPLDAQQPQQNSHANEEHQVEVKKEIISQAENNHAQAIECKLSLSSRTASQSALADQSRFINRARLQPTLEMVKVVSDFVINLADSEDEI